MKLNFGLEKPRRGREPMSRYFRRIAQGGSHEEAIREAFGVGHDALDRKLQRYV